jgi:hypothetical protein
MAPKNRRNRGTGVRYLEASRYAADVAKRSRAPKCPVGRVGREEVAGYGCASAARLAPYPRPAKSAFTRVSDALCGRGWRSIGAKRRCKPGEGRPANASALEFWHPPLTRLGLRPRHPLPASQGEGTEFAARLPATSRFELVAAHMFTCQTAQLASFIGPSLGAGAGVGP